MNQDILQLQLSLRTRIRRGFPQAGIQLAKLEGIHIPEMIQIPGKNFSIGKFPVTWKEYLQLSSKTSLPHDVSEQHPVERICFYNAIEFCNALSLQCHLQPAYTFSQEGFVFLLKTPGFRLPTENEWTCAASAGSNSSLPLISIHGQQQVANLHEIAWFSDNSNNHSQPVGVLQPNLFGVYDVIGNVWEMCWKDIPQQIPQHTTYTLPWNKLLPERHLLAENNETGCAGAYDSHSCLKGGCYFSEPWQANLNTSLYNPPLYFALLSKNQGFRIARSTHFDSETET